MIYINSTTSFVPQLSSYFFETAHPRNMSVPRSRVLDLMKVKRLSALLVPWKLIETRYNVASSPPSTIRNVYEPVIGYYGSAW